METAAQHGATLPDGEPRRDHLEDEINEAVALAIVTVTANLTDEDVATGVVDAKEPVTTATMEILEAIVRQGGALPGEPALLDLSRAVFALVVQAVTAVTAPQDGGQVPQDPNPRNPRRSRRSHRGAWVLVTMGVAVLCGIIGLAAANADSHTAPPDPGPAVTAPAEPVPAYTPSAEPTQDPYAQDPGTGTGTGGSGIGGHVRACVGGKHLHICT